MGRVKAEMQSYYDKGFSKPPDKHVCSNHFTDDSIIEFIDDNSVKATCSYCSLRYQNGQAILLEDLIEFLNEGIRHFYGDPNDEGVGYDSSEGGWIGTEIYDAYDLISDEILLDIDNSELQNDIIRSFSDQQWCIRDPYQLPEHQELSMDWNRFSEIVKHKIRYSFFRTEEFDLGNNKALSHILNDIANGVEALSLIKTLDLDVKIIRCRQHESAKKIIKFEHITAPPDNCANQPNRMSPAGISMFYGSFDKSTAKKETINLSKVRDLPFLTFGYFSLKRPLQVIDFTNLPEIPSIFDATKRKQHYLIIFFHKFVDELSKEIYEDGREHVEYVPTQILTEYFKYIFYQLTNNQIEGIVYKSSKSEKGKCVVFFMDNKSSSKYLKLDKTTYLEL